MDVTKLSDFDLMLLVYIVNNAVFTPRGHRLLWNETVKFLIDLEEERTRRLKNGD